MIVIYLRKGETIDRALKRFKQKCQRSGILKDYKKSKYYLKPSDKRKIAKNFAKKKYSRASTSR